MGRWLLLALVLAACTRPLEGARARATSLERAASSALPAAPPVARRPACEDLSRGGGARVLPPYPDRRPRGVDVSTPAPWRLLADQHIGFAFIAAAHSTEPAPAFAANWEMARRCGIPRGAYHFVTPDRDGTAQADVLLGQLAGDAGDLPPVIDVEQNPRCRDACCDLGCGAWQHTLATWLARVEARTGRRPLIYTARAFWQRCLCNTTRFADHPLWLAAPRDVDPRALPGFGGWTRWRFLQHDRQLRFAGGVVDLNLFAGAASELIPSYADAR